MTPKKTAGNLLLVAFALMVAAAGCKPPDIRDPILDESLPPQKKAPPTPAVTAAAGVTVKQQDVFPSPVVATMSRPDPFALTPVEASYEKQQMAAYFATDLGTFPLFYEAPPEVEVAPPVEPQPYRRLAGILIGSSVVALIDMGNGHTQEIYPGEIIPGTDWMVVSIDAEKAVLRRVGSNTLPHEIEVRLESAPDDGTNQQQPANPNGAENPVGPRGPAGPFGPRGRRPGGRGAGFGPAPGGSN